MVLGAEADNCFLTLQTADNKVASLQASCTEWRNLFSFELIGERGKFEISGLGGSYGTEKITLYQKRGEGRHPILRHGNTRWPMIHSNRK